MNSKPPSPPLLYQSLADRVDAAIAAGTLRAGERLPSVRQACSAHQLSPATVLQAYYLLEARGLIEARPRSGYYVRARIGSRLAEPEMSRPASAQTRLDVSDFIFEILEAVRDPDVAPREIVITSGAMEGITLCLQAATRPGDLVAIESPCFYGVLQAIERLGLKVVEIPTHPRDGINLAALGDALRQHPIRACVCMLNFQNPLGSLVPDEARRELIALLARHEVPLIEDDVYGELYFGQTRPLLSKALDDDGLVMHVSSFSKSLAPGYRIGWVAAGRYAERVRRLKISSSIATNVPAQAALADYLKHGGYENHLRHLRATLAAQEAAMVAAVEQSFPAGTRLARPQGGYFIWVELPPGSDALTMHRQALAQGISIAPGPIFSAKREYRNCIRLNTGHPWTPQIADAVAVLARLACISNTAERLSA